MEMDVSQVKSEKTEQGYRIKYGNRTYFLSGTGKILHSEAFLAVLRGLPIQLP